MKTSETYKRKRSVPIVIEFRTDNKNSSYDNMWYRVDPAYVKRRSSVLNALQNIGVYNVWKCPKIRYCPIKDIDTNPNTRTENERWAPIRIYNKQHYSLYNSVVNEWKSRFKTLYDVEQYKREQYELEHKDIDAYFRYLAEHKNY